MKLAEKTFVYSILLGSIMVSILVGYFAWMLPSLYTDYVKRDNLDSAIRTHEQYMDEKSYDKLTVKNPTSTLTVEIPYQKDEIKVASKFFTANILVEDEEIKEILKTFKDSLINTKEWDELEWNEENVRDMKNILSDKLFNKEVFASDYPLEIHVDTREMDDVFSENASHVHAVSDKMVVFELGTFDDNNYYTTYIAVERTGEELVMTILPVMSSNMDEVGPVIMRSIPMMITVVFFLVLVASQIFSKKIVNPVIRLANYARSLKIGNHVKIQPFLVEEKDEIGELATTLNELYEKLQENYSELEQKNNLLKEENKRQEVFMQASSHQLKTPITAALLLVDGMINEVGKYKDTKEYLPKVKEQIQSMRKIVEDILYLNHCAENLQNAPVLLGNLVKERIGCYQVQLVKKELTIKLEGEGKAKTDGEILNKILDNLISNAVQYTQKGGKIIVKISDNTIIVENYQARIEEELLPNIYEPFVSSDTKEKGKGLGLYVVSYYVKLLGGKISISNSEKGVKAELTLS